MGCRKGVKICGSLQPITAKRNYKEDCEDNNGLIHTEYTVGVQNIMGGVGGFLGGLGELAIREL